MSDAAELRRADEYEIDAPVSVEQRRNERVPVDARIARVRMSRGSPCVAKDDARHRNARVTGQHAYFVAVRIGVEVTAEHRGKRAGTVLSNEGTDLRDLRLAD